MEEQCAFCVIPGVKDSPSPWDTLRVKSADALLVHVRWPRVRLDAFLNEALPFGRGELLVVGVGLTPFALAVVWKEVLLRFLQSSIPKGDYALLCLRIKPLPVFGNLVAYHWFAWLTFCEVELTEAPALFACVPRSVNISKGASGWINGHRYQVMSVACEVPVCLMPDFLSGGSVLVTYSEIRFPGRVFSTVLGPLRMNGCHGGVDVGMLCVEVMPDAYFSLFLTVTGLETFVTPRVTPIAILNRNFVCANDRM